MKYSIALIFDKETSDQIYSVHQAIEKDLIIIDGLKAHSQAHMTVIKFESKNELNQDDLNKLIEGINTQLTLDFSGISILPSRTEPGQWLEVMILKNQQLMDLQEALLERLEEFEILSGVRDRFRPHVTFARTEKGVLNFDNLDAKILRRSQVPAKLVIGRAGDVFEFYRE